MLFGSVDDFLPNTYMNRLDRQSVVLPVGSHYNKVEGIPVLKSSTRRRKPTVGRTS